MAIPELVLRLVIAFITLIVLTRLMGRKEISQMTFFNFVSAISIGTLGASLAIDSSISITNGLIALVAWSVFTIFVGLLDIKSQKFRVVIEGEPRILVKKGQIMEDELRKVRLDIDALYALLRKKNVFSVSDDKVFGLLSISLLWLISSSIFLLCSLMTCSSKSIDYRLDCLPVLNSSPLRLPCISTLLKQKTPFSIYLQIFVNITSSTALDFCYIKSR